MEHSRACAHDCHACARLPLLRWTTATVHATTVALDLSIYLYGQRDSEISYILVYTPQSSHCTHAVCNCLTFASPRRICGPRRDRARPLPRPARRLRTSPATGPKTQTLNLNHKRLCMCVCVCLCVCVCVCARARARVRFCKQTAKCARILL